eukprot:CAMPEP_0206253214 /NCGR_PEP_ID=MMETSP0047_2-20121206/23033_1 /ASSEMBLY_ACC=CAM_ASM_000192 /TAXON_ID=195065 /ORGANISM="Chroomonas mesostigmatica_cf, Strain CCMP1168" /LENGTH=142 /DNA_ID=CAMNT_0053679409 /DNA_START=26 /DNA_END=454 /DNA_ORIENTATION=+
MPALADSTNAPAAPASEVAGKPAVVDSADAGELVVPEAKDLKEVITAIKLASPDMGVAKVHAAVKAQHPNWQVSQDRVKKIVADAAVLTDESGKAKMVPKNLAAKQEHKKAVMEAQRKKTEAAQAKRKAELKKVDRIPTKLC